METDLKRILTTALCCVLLQVKTSCEAVQDFDYIWEACRDKSANISSVFEDNQSSKECAWMLSVATHLQEENNASPPTSSHVEKRRARLVLSGACIAIVARSALWLGRSTSKTKQIEESKNNEENKTSALLDVIVDAMNQLKRSTEKKISLNHFSKTLHEAAMIASKVNLFSDENKIESIVQGTGPIQSLFSTHHGRVTAIGLLNKFIRASINSSSIHSPNGPSIFTSFHFVDEILLEAQATSYVRLYLIEFSDKKSSASGQVAAEVQFYENKVETTAPDSDSDDFELNTKLPLQSTLELNLWTSRLLDYSDRRIKPSTKLLYYIGTSNIDKVFRENQESVGNVMIPIINKALQGLNKAQKDTDQSMQVDLLGGMEANQQDCFSSKTKIKAETIGRAMLSFYYHAAESILDYETARLKTTSHRRLLMSADFHKALLSVCLVCVVHATSGSSSSFQNDSYIDNSQSFLQSILTLIDCTEYEYMKVSESFLHGMDSSANSMRNKICKLPTELQQKLRDIEEEILESSLWKNCTKIQSDRLVVGVIKSLMSSSDQDKKSWPPRVLDRIQDEQTETAQPFLDGDSSSESQYVDYLLTKVMGLASKRVDILCTNLGIDPRNPLMKRIWNTFLQLLTHNIHLIYGRHIDQLILCTVYSVGKVTKYTPELTFSNIIDVYTSSFEKKFGKLAVERILRNVILLNNEQGSVIDFYNQCYITCMKKTLMKIKLVNKSTSLEINEKKRSCEDNAIAATACQAKRSKGMEKCNLQVNVRFSDSKAQNYSPKSRVLYSFGDASAVKVRLSSIY